MFSLFKKKQPKQYQDIVWLSQNAKFKGIQGLCSNTSYLIVVSSFKKSLDEFEASLSPSHNFLRMNGLKDFSSGRHNYLVNSKLLIEPSFMQSPFKYLPAKDVKFVLLEHYPILTTDQMLINKLVTNSQVGVGISVYLSFDDPQLKLFGSSRIVEVMQRLGLDENEPVEHSLITNSIEKATKRVNSKVKYEIKTDSIDEWYRMNYAGTLER